VECIFVVERTELRTCRVVFFLSYAPTGLVTAYHGRHAMSCSCHVLAIHCPLTTLSRIGKAHSRALFFL